MFDAQKEVLSLTKKEFLPERIAQFLLSVLAEQIGQKKTMLSLLLMVLLWNLAFARAMVRILTAQA